MILSIQKKDQLNQIKKKILYVHVTYQPSSSSIGKSFANQQTLFSDFYYTCNTDGTTKNCLRTKKIYYNLEQKE
jgi:hypothetical protein